MLSSLRLFAAFALVASVVVPVFAQDVRSSPDAITELHRRQEMVENRLLAGTEPTFTPEFILADVASTQTIGKRRFDEFHGDLSGRYISTVSNYPEGDRPAWFPQLLTDLIALQQPDGRFGRMALHFIPQEIDGQHMALLWGNGRLLVGLVDAARVYPRDDIRASAVRLGDFLLNIIDVCSTPEMAERLKGLKANGYICFTQLTEGLAMLTDLTGDQKYAAAAQRIYPMLPQRGLQHSHGYLCTLRGVMMIYQQLKNPADLAFVEKHFADLVSSSDYTPTGGVNEYFGTFADHKENLRDEGCSEADMLWLCLQLWEATGKADYLDRARRCYHNAFNFNQFATGDFGHHKLDNTSGYQLGNQDHRAWWCCTMHGARALQQVAHCVEETTAPFFASADLQPRLLTKEGRLVPLDSITQRTQGYLFNGPYLLGADGIAAPGFTAEPMGTNPIKAGSVRRGASAGSLPSYTSAAHLEFDYTHDGFPGTWTVRLRPISDLSFDRRTWTRMLLTFEP